MPDVFSRLHPSTKCDTLGAGSTLLAMIIYGGWSSDIPRLVAIGFFLLISSATCGHAIARCALKNGMSLRKKELGMLEQKENSNTSDY